MKQIRPAVAVLTVVFPILALVGFLAACGAIIYALNSFGHHAFMAAALVLLLIALLIGPRLQPGRAVDAALGWRSHLWRMRTYARKGFVAVLTCWLGLNGWAALTQGGGPPEPKTDPSNIRVVTWNILHGRQSGPPWSRVTLSNWAVRRASLETALQQAEPDILCVQEALAEQVAFLEETLPTHQRVGVGRDDGASAGEHCAIFFRTDRFDHLEGNTFWLEEPTDQPCRNPATHIKRICTWVRLRDRATGETLRVYNVHSYLTERSRLSAAQVLLDHLAQGDPRDAVIVTGDFNAPPSAPSRQLLAAAGLRESASWNGQSSTRPTYQWYGLRLRSLDGILVNTPWQVRHHHVLDMKPGNTFPSDHFGVLADLALSG